MEQSNGMKNFWTSTKRVFRKTLIFGSIIAVLGVSAYFLFARYVHFSDGVRSGQVVKFSKKGIIFKTWEGQLQYGEASNLWEFSVYPGNDEVQEKILEAVAKGTRVQLSYDESYVSFSLWGDTKYFVNDVEIIP